jgi:hypothetical protein
VIVLSQVLKYFSSCFTHRHIQNQRTSDHEGKRGEKKTKKRKKNVSGRLFAGNTNAGRAIKGLGRVTTFKSDRFISGFKIIFVLFHTQACTKPTYK